MRLLPHRPDPLIALIDANMETVRRFEEVERQRHLLVAALGDVLLATDLDAAHLAASQALKPITIIGYPGDQPDKWRDTFGQIINRNAP